MDGEGLERCDARVGPALGGAPVDGQHVVSEVFAEHQAGDGWLRLQLVRRRQLHLHVLDLTASGGGVRRDDDGRDDGEGRGG